MNPPERLRKLAVGTARAIVRTGLVLVRAILGEKGFLRLASFINRQIDPVIVNDGIRFDARDTIPLQRALTLLTKEPDTIRWIEDFFSAGDVFYDVGANVGVFSLYAAMKRGARVLAFEPMCSNYDVLNRNIFLNGQSGGITAYNVAFHDRSIASQLNLSAFVAGKAGHGFDAASNHGHAFTPAFQQGMIGLGMEDFIQRFAAPFPNHIKIDVDGNEGLIVRGMGGMLRDARLKSLAVELDPKASPLDREAYDTIIQAGFSALEDTRYINTQFAHYTNIRNYFFVRR